MRLRVALSTCPNDTFAFHGLLTGRVEVPGIELDFVLGDVQELNERFLAGEFDVSKLSFAAALERADELTVLESGAALGFGVGPLLLASRAYAAQQAGAPRVLAPGRHTTAHLLLRLFHPELEDIESVVFSSILPALEGGQADLGVCIHEGRFTYAERGLQRVEDLGERWEQETGAPLPLGGIVARRSLPTEVRTRLAGALRRSIDYGFAHRAETLTTMRAHAQELDDDVIEAHVDLYVNQWTRRLGERGEHALAELSRRASAETASPARLAIDRDPEPDAPRLFHLVPAADWTRFEESGREELDSPSLAREGFVHASFPHQLAGTLKAHFGEHDAVELCELRRDALEPHLRLERSRGGESFPHVYRALRRSDLGARFALRRDADGRWCWPSLS